MPDCPALLTSLLGLDTAGSWHGSTNVLVELAVSMRAHGRGGSILMVPSGSDSWRESIVHPMPYHVLPPFSALADLVRQRRRRRAASREWQDELDDIVKAVAGLTAVDGATLLTDRFELLAFGAKISRARGRPQVEQVVATEPIEGVEAEVVHPSRLGGTRHLSAAQFVHDQRDADRAGRVAGRPVHGVRLVAVRRHGARAPRRDAAAVAQSESDQISRHRPGSKIATCRPRPVRRPAPCNRRSPGRVCVRARRRMRDLLARTDRSPTGRRLPTAGTTSSSIPTWPMAAATGAAATPPTRPRPAGRSCASRTSRTIQTLEYNPVNGGIERWFEPIEPDSRQRRQHADRFSASAGRCSTRWRRRGRDWRIEVHQFRIEARPDEQGRPTPEGLHRDGVDYVLVLLVDRRNIARGVTTIHAPDGAELGHFTLTDPFDAALVDDSRVAHGVTPVAAIDPRAAGVS